jgi:hypothetical protein
LLRSTPTHRAVPRRLTVLALFAAALLPAAGVAVAQERVITPAVSIEQDQLDLGAYTPNEVLQAGRQFFAAAFLPEDGHGEGDTGPRATQRQELWRTAVTGSGLEIPFLRVNGLDSQACFECHNSAGTHVAEGELHRTQKPGGLGGSAGFASVLFGNQFFPRDTSSQAEALESKEIAVPAERLTHIVRAPPKSFGTAYVQELAIEMTGDLQEIEADAFTQAAATPTIPITKALTTKGISFGTITITCPTSSCGNPTRDVSNVQGVSTKDLIVRPFQHKGVTATLRSFTKTALDFHFSMQPVEVVGRNNDCDLDALRNEMAVDVVSFAANDQSIQVQRSLGNVAALAAFSGMLRPPVSNTGSGSKGEEIFHQIGCASCHEPELDTRRNPLLRIELVFELPEECPDTTVYGGTPSLGSFAEVDSAQHPALRAVDEQKQEDLTGTVGGCPSGFYCIDLTNPGTVPDEFLPRLPQNPNGTVTVPLYSDLKRHDLGPFLAQQSPAQRDDEGTPIDNLEWLTTKLWGVADNGPWLHDGRARTLEEAILMHDGANGNANQGEAVAEVNAFQALSTSDKEDLIDFLESLSVPASP